jgi:hypothetical protein
VSRGGQHLKHAVEQIDDPADDPKGDRHREKNQQA